MADFPDRLRAGIADRYDIERELGSGGMATVYLARDLKHDRDVAVKVLRSELAAAIGSDRFLREIRITARLNHPHILPLLDSGEAEGLLFYVMPHVSGGSLRRCLNREPQLPLTQILRITQHVAAALDYAHGRGVIHRDVKPENILFSEGHAIVSDFGIARAVSAAGPEHLTRSGFPLGTPGYMSPEQAMGTLELDERTDVYGLACVAYEMLIGETPGMWPTDDALRLARLIDASPEHRERLDKLPGRVEAALTRALALRPADRFASPGQFADALAAATERRPRFDEDEMREIIRRAAERQAEQPTQTGTLTIGSIEQIAAEVGIPPAHVREAVRELERSSVSPMRERQARAPAVFDTRRNSVYAERTIEGEVPPSEFAALVEEIQATLDMAGHASTIGGSLTWSPAALGAQGRKLAINITPLAGATRIRIEERLELTGWRSVAPGWGAAGGGLLGLLLGLGIEGPGPYMIIPAAVLAFWGGFAAANTLMWTLAERRKLEHAALADRLAGWAEEAARRCSRLGV